MACAFCFPNCIKDVILRACDEEGDKKRGRNQGE